MIDNVIAGDRILSVNGESVEKKSYGDVIQLIQATGDVLELAVVPRQDDILQIVSFFLSSKLYLLFSVVCSSNYHTVNKRPYNLVNY